MPQQAIARDPSAVTPEVRRLYAEAREQFPEVLRDDSAEFLPQTPRRGRCAICGSTEELTREHIPPRAAFNKGRGRFHTLADYLAGRNMTRGPIAQGGSWAYTLCGDCNNLTGRLYAPEYQRWAVTAFNALADAHVNVQALEHLEETPRGMLEFSGARPGAFIREVLAVMCSLSPRLLLTERYPALRRMILEGTPEPMPAGLRVELNLFLGSHWRGGAPLVICDTTRSVWRCVGELAAAPFQIALTLGGTDTARLGFDLSEFTMTRPDEVRDMAADIAIALGATPYPADIRTPAMVRRQAEE